tara:strand:- start:2538 stop:2744 length:207 start_codon:yes stop_codon:yes gene_type:complete
MNLILRPLDNANDPVWSVIICVILAVAGALFVVVYILRMAFAELDNDGSNQPEGCEPGPADSTPDTQD